MGNLNGQQELPVPDFYADERVGEIWRVPYETRARQAREWAAEHKLQAASEDQQKVALLLVDVQNTFCIPEFELFVGGRSGLGAVEDNQRLVNFIYRNLGQISQIALTLDTHQVMQIFHAMLLIDAHGEHPAPYTQVSVEDVRSGRWRFNPQAASSLGMHAAYGQQHLLHYVETLERRGKYALTVWPYHAMLGGIGHALVPAVEEAVFFHSVARQSQPIFEVKGSHPLTEHYSAVGPEVEQGAQGEPLAGRSKKFFELLHKHDRVYIAGQAKSHCVAWTIADLLEDSRAVDASLAEKVYLLEDCSSPVVVPGVVDYTEAAEEAYRGFAAAGMKVVQATDGDNGWGTGCG